MGEDTSPPQPGKEKCYDQFDVNRIYEKVKNDIAMDKIEHDPTKITSLDESHQLETCWILSFCNRINFSPHLCCIVFTSDILLRFDEKIIK